jgi:hypothetical protein
MARTPAKGRRGGGAAPDAPELPPGPSAADGAPGAASGGAPDGVRDAASGGARDAASGGAPDGARDAASGGARDTASGGAPSPKPKAKTPRKRAPRGPAAGPAPIAGPIHWPRLAALMLIGVCALRLAINALGLIPVHFDEAQYWAYGEAFDYGYFSKPPLVAWLIRVATEGLGDTLFALRLFAPLAHLAIGALIYAIGARLYEARTGFWAAALYTAGPGVVVSAMLMTTDPPMMIGWGVALYAYVRVTEPVARAAGARASLTAALPPRWGWWALAGLGLGVGMMAKYTAVAVVIGVIGHMRFSAETRPGAGWRGPLVALGVALLALSPNIMWNAAHGFATVMHLGDNAEIGSGGPLLRPGKLAEFLGAQLAVIGPAAAVAGIAAMAMLALRPAARADRRLRLLAWFAAPLLLIMTAQALHAGANANWAAPAWISGCVIAAHALSAPRWAWARWAQIAIGGVTAAGLLGAAALYAVAGPELPRFFDPFKKMRNGEPFCEVALSALENEGADALLMVDRRRLSECMFIGELTMDEVAIIDTDGRVDNHFEMAAPLRPGDTRAFVLIDENAEQAEAIAAGFEDAQFIGEGGFATHADRAVTWVMWRVEGRITP